MKLKYIIAVLILLCQIANAAITNPSFESGLTGWSNNINPSYFPGCSSISSTWSTDGSHSLLLSGTGVSAIRHQTLDLTDVDYIKVDVHYRKTSGLYGIQCYLAVYNTTLQQVRLVNANNLESTTFTDETLIINTKDLNGNYIIALIGGGSSGAEWISVGEAYFDNVVLIMNSSSVPSYPQSNGKVYFTNDPYEYNDVATYIANVNSTNLGWHTDFFPAGGSLWNPVYFYYTTVVVELNAGNYTSYYQNIQNLDRNEFTEDDAEAQYLHFPLTNGIPNTLQARYIERTYLYTQAFPYVEGVFPEWFSGGKLIIRLLGQWIDISPVAIHDEVIDIDYAYHKNEETIFTPVTLPVDDTPPENITPPSDYEEVYNQSIESNYTPPKIFQNLTNFSSVYNFTNITYLTQLSNLTEITLVNVTNVSYITVVYNNTTYYTPIIPISPINVTNTSSYNYTYIQINTSYMQDINKDAENTLGRTTDFINDSVSFFLSPLKSVTTGIIELNSFFNKYKPDLRLWTLLIPPIFEAMPSPIINTVAYGLILLLILIILGR